MSLITRGVINGCRARLAHPDTGFNARLAEALADAALTLPTNFKTPIVFDLDTSLNYFEADMAPADLERTRTLTYPAITMYGKSAIDQGRYKFQKFTGDVVVGLNLYLSYRVEKKNVHYDSIANAFEEAIISTFNDRDLGPWSTDYGFVYNGRLSVRRGPLNQRGGIDFLQSLSIDLSCSVHTS